MIAEVVLLPSMLTPEHLQGRTVVVFDVLRATTTMTAALAAGIQEIRVFGNVDEARAAAEAFDGAKLLCGEHDCLPPAGFDLGNSPGQFSRKEHEGRVVFMATTNGTRAILAAREAAIVLVGALVNATAVAEAAEKTGGDVTLLCAGTNGAVAMEDLLGTGAVLRELLQGGYAMVSDAARISEWMFETSASNLRELLTASSGGVNVIRAGLKADIEFASQHDSLRAVGKVERVLNNTRIVPFR